MQPPLPLVAYDDAIAGILIEKHLVTLSNQPPMQPSGALPIHAGVTDEYPGHYPSPDQTAQIGTFDHHPIFQAGALRVTIVSTPRTVTPIPHQNRARSGTNRITQHHPPPTTINRRLRLRS
jgi:hypothetical protein